MNYVFWINFSLAVFFGFMNLVMAVVLFLYYLNLGAVRTSMEELQGTAILAGFILVFSILTGVVAWGARRRRYWIWPVELMAVGVAVTAVLFIRSFA